MLVTLRVKNLALVESVRVDFGPGLNIITGETGAGKSILLGALSLLLGERADKKYIRTGADACGAEALFELKRPGPINALLEDAGVSPCEDGQLVIRRIVKANGSSQNIINDSPVTLQVLKRLGEELIDMHGPHDHQALLSTEYQLDVLDAYGHTAEARATYRVQFDKLQSLLARKAELESVGSDVSGQIDLLKYRISEIEEAEPEEGEEEKVRQEHLVAGNAQRILDVGGGIVQALTEGDASALDALAGVQRQLEELERLIPEAATWKAEAKSAAIAVKELGGTISDRLSQVEADPSRLAWLEERMAAYQKLRRKYGGSITEVLATLAEAKDRLKDLETRGEQLGLLEREIASVTKAMTKAGEALRAARAEVSKKLATAITRELRELGFAHGGFAVELMPSAEPKASGLDDVEFGFAPNVGEAMKPLRDIASSGEISRVMLATKVVLSGHDKVPVLIFDEIDANIGGETGNAVGRKLEVLGKSHQVICITHLPQVAVHGAQHHAVSKKVKDGRTTTDVLPLDQDTRVEEIARMLGGRDLTKVTLQHAREMLKAR